MTGARVMLALAAVVALGAAVASCGGSGESTTTPTSKQPALDVTLHAMTHRPSVSKPWPIVVRAYDRAGRPLKAEVGYQYLFGGAVVARRSHYRFRGIFRDSFHWPARAIGIPLTFRAVVTTALGTRRLDYDVKVKR